MVNINILQIFDNFPIEDLPINPPIIAETVPGSGQPAHVIVILILVTDSGRKRKTKLLNFQYAWNNYLHIMTVPSWTQIRIGLFRHYKVWSQKCCKFPHEYKSLVLQQGRRHLISAWNNSPNSAKMVNQMKGYYYPTTGQV